KEPLYTNDFENEPTDWEMYGVGQGENSWKWGIPTSGPTEALTGENVVATNLDGYYNQSENSYFESPAIELPEGEAYLQFEHWYSFATNWDYGFLLAKNSLDYNWTVLEELTGESNGWEKAVYDLSDFSGDDVYLAFRLNTDVLFSRDGWYIDNIMITDDSLGKSAGSGLTTSQIAASSQLPLDATVSVMETNHSTSTYPSNGSFSLLHEDGEYTVVAETYG